MLAKDINDQKQASAEAAVLVRQFERQLLAEYVRVHNPKWLVSLSTRIS